MAHRVCFCVVLFVCTFHSAALTECMGEGERRAECIVEDIGMADMSLLQRSISSVAGGRAVATMAEASGLSAAGTAAAANKCSPSQELLALPGGLDEQLVHTLDLDKPRAPSASLVGIVKSTLHETRLAEVKLLDLHPLSLIFYGDSITELWRGESVGKQISVEEGGCTRVESYGDLLHDRFVARFGPAAVMAVGGDTSAELLWRLQNGEAFSHVPDAVMVHIGINDINSDLGGFAYLNPCSVAQQLGMIAHPRSEFGNADADNVYFGIKAVVQQIMNGCQAPVVLTGLFPTGYEWPAGPYGAVIPRVNWLLQQLAAASKGRLHVIDCSWAVLNNATGKIDPELMPDYLHPSPAGGDRWATCMSQALECKVLGSRAC